MHTLNDDDVVEDLLAQSLSLVWLRVLHLISELVSAQLQQRGNVRDLVSEQLEFSVDFHLEIDFTSCQALVVVVERK